MKELQSALVEVLSAGDRAYAAQLEQCKITSENGSLVIDCPHLDIVRNIEMHPERLAIAARDWGLTTIALWCPGMLDINFQADTLFKYLEGR